jgi:hypothetical protein
MGMGKTQSALAQKHGPSVQASWRRRQHFGEQQVPHQQLQQDGDIAEQLDIGITQAAHQRIAREPANADQGAQDGREDDAEMATRSVLVEADQEGRQ